MYNYDDYKKAEKMIIFPLEEVGDAIENGKLDLGTENAHVKNHCDKVLEHRPKFFNRSEVVSGYEFWFNEHGRVYVPQTEKNFNAFIDNIFQMKGNYSQFQVDNYNLIRQYPFLLPVNRFDGGLNLSGDFIYEFQYTELDDLPKGWRNSFVKDLLKELKKELEKHHLLYCYRILQLKEKFGGLRWYDFSNTENGYAIIEKYANISQHTCVNCGAEGKMRNRSWIIPLCDDCETQPSVKLNLYER